MSTVAEQALRVNPAPKKQPKARSPRPAVDVGAISQLPEDQQQDAFLAALPNDAERARVIFSRRRLTAYAKSPFNRRVQRLIAMLAKVQDELEQMAGTDEHHEITRAWARAGVPFDEDAADDDEQENAERTLDLASHVRQAAAGATWAVECYLSQLDGMVVDRPRRARR